MFEVARRYNLPLAGFPIHSTTSAALSRLLKERLEASRKTILVFANTNFVIKCQQMRSWLCGEDVVIVNDGVGMDIAALLLHKQRFRENLNGTDFLPFFFRHTTARRRVFLLGGKEGVAEAAAVYMREALGQEIVGYADGYAAIRDPELCEYINASGAEILLVAMGNPVQEEWIRGHMGSLDATLFVCVGALFDFFSGRVKRAPLWVQRVRLEWLFRLMHEPKRLLRRYTVDIAQFLVLCLGSARPLAGETPARDALL